VLYTVARYEAALEVFEQVAVWYDARGDLDGRARVLTMIAWTHGQRGAAEEGIARLLPLLPLDLPQEFPPSGIAPAGLSAAYAALCFLYFVLGRYEELLPIAERALALTRAIPEGAAPGTVVMHLASALLGLGRVEEGLQVLEPVIPQLEASHQVWPLIFTLADVSYVHEDRGALDASAAELERALGLAERLILQLRLVA
jgi:tetratricopeptide (TPR) repeat protein